MATVLMPLPRSDFDPTETGVPWRALSERGHRLVFATPDGKAGAADPEMITGKGLGIFARLLKADQNGRSAYEAMARDPAFTRPMRYDDVHESEFDALLLPGGHAKGMRPYLESPVLRLMVSSFFARQKSVGAICHGVLLAARSRDGGKSVLHGRKTTALTRRMELGAFPRPARSRLHASRRPLPVRPLARRCASLRCRLRGDAGARQDIDGIQPDATYLRRGSDAHSLTLPLLLNGLLPLRKYAGKGFEN